MNWGVSTDVRMPEDMEEETEVKWTDWAVFIRAYHTWHLLYVAVHLFPRLGGGLLDAATSATQSHPASDEPILDSAPLIN